MNDNLTNTVILPALSKVAGTERSLPAMPGVRGPITGSPSTISDPLTSIVILSERSDAKDLYLPRLAPLSPKPAAAGATRNR